MYRASTERAVSYRRNISSRYVRSNQRAGVRMRPSLIRYRDARVAKRAALSHTLPHAPRRICADSGRSRGHYRTAGADCATFMTTAADGRVFGCEADIRIGLHTGAAPVTSTASNLSVSAVVDEKN